MLRQFRTLPLAIVLASATIFATSCGSTSAKLRIVQAIPDVPAGQPVDIYLDGKKLGAAVQYGGLFPASGYQSVSTGARHLQVYLSGQTTGAYFDGNLSSLNNGSEYTAVLTGSVTSNTVVAPLLTDNNTAPTSGNFGLRIIHASPTWNNFFGGMDVYVVAPGTPIGGVSPTVSNLTYKNASNNNNNYPSAPAGTYEIIATPVGLKAGDIDQVYTFAAGQLRTLVVVDAPGGGLSGTPLVLNDLK